MIARRLVLTLHKQDRFRPFLARQFWQPNLSLIMAPANAEFDRARTLPETQP